MILEIDQGNTRLKWRLVEAGVVLHRGIEFNQKLEFDRWLESISEHSVSAVRAASVAGEQWQRRISESISRATGVEVQFAKVEIECAGVICGYSDPSKLGIDRWLAVLATSRLMPGACLVVDCGSALTVDFWTGGEHLGGYISPGYELMRTALYGQTAQVKVEGGAEPCLEPGAATEDAVNAGLWAALAGIVMAAERKLSRLLQGADISLVVCGGDGARLVEILDGAEYYPELVLDGLVLCLPSESGKSE